MKKTVTLFITCLMALSVIAQNKAEINVEYEFTAPQRTGKSLAQKMILLASPSESKYFNNTSLWVDSLKSTPDGEAKYHEIFLKSCVTENPDGSVYIDMRKGPTKNVYTVVFNKLANDQITVYDKFGEDLYYYHEPLSEQEWQIIDDSTTNILGYECVMAETSYHGRNWKAWFSPEVAVPFGPWKLRGLPGLIMKAEADGGFSFEAKGIEASDRIMYPMYMKEDYSKTERKKALENKEYFTNNEESIMGARGTAMKVVMVDDDGNEIPIPKFEAKLHAIECDYK